MQELTTLEILQVLTRYGNCAVLIFDGPEPTPATLEGIMYYEGVVFVERTTEEPRLVKPVLKVLHHLTSTEILQACRAYDSVPFGMATNKNTKIENIDNTTQKRITIEGCKYSYRFNYKTGAIAVHKDGHCIMPYDSQGFLTQHYYNEGIAIPLYFGPGHWANGKTAIELGIAVPSRYRLFDVLKEVFNGDKEQIALWVHEAEAYHKINLFEPNILDEKISELKNMIVR